MTRAAYPGTVAARRLFPAAVVAFLAGCAVVLRTGPVAVSGIYVANAAGNSVSVYPMDASRDVSPVRVIVG
ncbi:MAG: hypothetical protein QN166_05940, partial [Armatimonadota bacterium]|nr:hypothetical protein [Armatimonadota bacterium]